MTRRPPVRARLHRTLPLFLAALSLPTLAPAATWTNPTGGSWSTASNWSPASVPGNYVTGQPITDSTAVFNLGATAPDLPSYPGYTVAVPNGLNGVTASVLTDKVTFTQPTANNSASFLLDLAPASTQTASITLSGGTFSLENVSTLTPKGTASLTVGANTLLTQLDLSLTATDPGDNVALAATGPNSFIQAYTLNLGSRPGSVSLNLADGGTALMDPGLTSPKPVFPINYQVVYGAANIGYNNGTAHVTVTGAGSTFAFASWNIGADGGTGTVALSAGAHAYVSTFALGYHAGTGALSLDGTGTTLTSNSNQTLVVGGNALNAGTTPPAGPGFGTLSLSNSATLSAPHSALQIGVSGGVGTASLASASSLSADQIYVGLNTGSSGTLTLSSGASVSASTAYVGPFTGTITSTSPSGTVTLSSDTTSPSTLTLSGTLYLHKGSVTLNPGGQLLAGTINFGAQGTLALHGGSASASSAVQLYGGTLTGSGTLHAPLIDASTFSPTISPDGTLALDADLSLASSAATLAFDLTSPTSYDRLTSLHTLTPGGTLALSLSLSYAPQLGDSFDLLDFATLTPNSTFSTFSLPPLPNNLIWDTSALYSTGTLSIALPEPTPLLAACGLALLPLTRRRRQLAP